VGEVACQGGQGERLVPPHTRTRGSVSLFLYLGDVGSTLYDKVPEAINFRALAQEVQLKSLESEDAITECGVEFSEHGPEIQQLQALCHISPCQSYSPRCGRRRRPGPGGRVIENKHSN
jgi:hypothetical protein